MLLPSFTRGLGVGAIMLQRWGGALAKRTAPSSGRFGSPRDSMQKNPVRMVADMVDRALQAGPVLRFFRFQTATTTPKGDVGRARRARLYHPCDAPFKLAGRRARSGTGRTNSAGARNRLGASVVTIAERRGRDKAYHLIDVDQLRALAPGSSGGRCCRSGAACVGGHQCCGAGIIEASRRAARGSAVVGLESVAPMTCAGAGRPILASAIAGEDFRFEQIVLAAVVSRFRVGRPS